MSILNEAKSTTEIFGEPISTYSAEQAVEDGVLVTITAKDLATRTVWEWLCEHAPVDEPPTYWPIDLFGFCRAGKISKTEALKMIAELGKDDAQAKLEQMAKDGRTLAMCKGLIGEHSRAAISAEYDRGETYTLYARRPKQTITMLSASAPEKDDAHNWQTMYLRPNELGGVTLLFPEDD